MQMNACLVVMQKELLDGIRDKRALLAMLLFPLIGPVMIYFMLHSLLDIKSEAQQIELPVVGQQYAADLVDYLQQHDIDLEDVSFSNKEEIQQAIKNRQHDFILLIPADFPEVFSQGNSAYIEIYSDSSRAKANPKVEQVKNLITAWSNEIAALRLVLRGINPEVVRPTVLQHIEVASEQERAARVLSFIPMFIIMAAFICGMGIAVDSTAGERERRSLEPLLVNPVSRVSIVLGKWLAAACFATCGVLVTMLLSLTTLHFIPLSQLGLSFQLGPLEISGMLAAIVPMAFLATALQIFVATFARSFKDAQSYLSLLVMLPMAPVMLNLFNSMGRSSWMSLVPGLGQHMLLVDVIGGNPPPIFDFIVASITALSLGLLCLYATAKLFSKESIIFT